MERTAEHMVVAGTPERCFAVVSDVERYPEWVADVKEVEVLERDDDGRARLVRFRAGAFGRSPSYVLAYDYSEAPIALSWTQRDGDITRSLDGSYRFLADGAGIDRGHLRVAQSTCGFRSPASCAGAPRATSSTRRFAT